MIRFLNNRFVAQGGERGFSLIEIVIALGITAFAIIGVIGLLSGALQSNRESEQRIQAANLVAALFVQYQNALNNKVSGGSWPASAPIPETALNSTTAADDYSKPVGITLQGAKANGLTADDTAFACSYIVWKSDLGAKAPYTLVNCALRLQWPPTAAQGNSKSIEHYDAVTSFLVQQ